MVHVVIVIDRAPMGLFDLVTKLTLEVIFELFCQLIEVLISFRSLHDYLVRILVTWPKSTGHSINFAHPFLFNNFLIGNKTDLFALNIVQHWATGIHRLNIPLFRLNLKRIDSCIPCRGRLLDVEHDSRILGFRFNGKKLHSSLASIFSLFHGVPRWIKSASHEEYGLLLLAKLRSLFSLSDLRLIDELLWLSRIQGIIWIARLRKFIAVVQLLHNGTPLRVDA